MTKEEIKKWFWNKFNSCYPVVHEDYKENIILYYDKNFVRQKKLCRITGEKIKYPKKIVGHWLFYLDWRNGSLDCNYEYIWSFLEENYLFDYIIIRNLINEIFYEHYKMSVLTPNLKITDYSYIFKEHDKLMVSIKGIYIDYNIYDYKNLLLRKYDKLKPRWQPFWAGKNVF